MDVQATDLVEAFRRMFPVQFELASAQVIIDMQAAEIQDLRNQIATMEGVTEDVGS